MASLKFLFSHKITNSLHLRCRHMKGSTVLYIASKYSCQLTSSLCLQTEIYVNLLLNYQLKITLYVPCIYVSINFYFCIAHLCPCHKFKHTIFSTTSNMCSTSLCAKHQQLSDAMYKEVNEKPLRKKHSSNLSV